MKYFLTAFTRFGFILSIFLLGRYWFDGKVVLLWRDLFIAVIFLAASLFQDYRATKKQIEIDKRLEAERKNQSWGG